MKSKIALYLKIIIPVIIIFLSSWIWNTIIFDELIKFGLLNPIFQIQLEDLGVILILSAIIMSGLLGFYYGSNFWNFIKKLTNSIKIFGILSFPTILLVLVFLVITSIIFYNALFDTLLLFHGDYIIIFVLSFLFCSLFKLNKNDECPNFEIDYYERAIKNPDEDILGFKTTAEQMTFEISTVQNGVNPVSIVLLGAWGSGKTSIFNLVKFYVNEKSNLAPYNRFRIVTLNLSQYENVKIVYIHFLYVLLRKLEEEYILPRLDTKLLFYDLFEKIFKGFKLSKLQNKMIELPKIEEYLQKISKWLCQSNLFFIVFIDDIDRIGKKGVDGVFKMERLVKANMKNIILLFATDSLTIKKFHKRLSKG